MSCALTVTVPLGWPPSAAHDPPLGYVSNLRLFTLLVEVQPEEGGAKLVPAFAVQFAFPHGVTWPPWLQSTPDGAPQVQGEHSRLSVAPP
jgi:hypothetical protein